MAFGAETIKVLSFLTKIKQVYGILNISQIYFYPIYAGLNPMSTTQYIIGIVCIILTVAMVIKKNEVYQ